MADDLATELLDGLIDVSGPLGDLKRLCECGQIRQSEISTQN
jgi:hypothetical protein